MTTIKEDFKLPSEGKIYAKPIDPNISLRSMTVEDEMKRLSPSKNPYKNMSEMIESCLSEKLPIPVYKLCLGDYIYLLHKLRTVTYGPTYHTRFQCPICNKIEEFDINLDEEKILKYDKSIEKLMTIELPVTKHKVKLRFQTPADLDWIVNRTTELKEQNPDMKFDPYVALTLETFIDSIDDHPVDKALIYEQIKELPMADANAILKKGSELNEKVGVDTIVKVHCDNCNNDVNITFPYTSEFYGPTID